MKKKIKNIISLIFPKGTVREQLKLIYYNVFTSSNIKFSLKKGSDGIVYFTEIDSIGLFSKEALYTIVDDYDYYQHFYKVKKNDIVLDASANCGHLTTYFSKIVSDNGIVYAFEPDNINIKRIEQNISLNTDLANNIKIEELLLWDKNGLIDFYEAGTAGSSAVWKPSIELCVKKQAISIDEWVNENKISDLNFIKMDIEGAEIEALQGCVETIKKLKPNFAIASYHIVKGEQTYIRLEEFFKQINYPFKTVRFKKTEVITFAGENIF
jgi:FkbM family methyltransferase